MRDIHGTRWRDKIVGAGNILARIHDCLCVDKGADNTGEQGRASTPRIVELGQMSLRMLRGEA